MYVSVMRKLCRMKTIRTHNGNTVLVFSSFHLTSLSNKLKFKLFTATEIKSINDAVLDTLPKCCKINCYYTVQLLACTLAS